MISRVEAVVGEVGGEEALVVDEVVVVAVAGGEEAGVVEAVRRSGMFHSPYLASLGLNHDQLLLILILILSGLLLPY